MAHPLAARHVPAHDQNFASFLLSLIAGFWMLASAGLASGVWLQDIHGMMGPAHSGEWGRAYPVDNWSGAYSWMYGRGLYGSGEWWPWLAFVAGLSIIAGGFILYLKPDQRRNWGAAIIILSALDFLFGMGGLGAAALGIIAGMVALAD